MEQITHAHVNRLVFQLPKPFADKYFGWRREAMNRQGLRYTSPEFIAECLQKAVALHAEVDRVLAGFSGDKVYTEQQFDSQSPQESNNGET